MNSRKSKFDSSHLVVFVEEGDEKYTDLKPMFRKHGLAFKHGKTIVMDMTTLRAKGYDDDAHMTFIEAHELGHSVLGHTTTKREFEAEADYIGILLCGARNYTKSEKLGKKYFRTRNGVSFDKYSERYDTELRRKLSKTKYKN